MKSNNFEEFYAKLIDHEIWYDQMKMRFYRKDLKDVANQCFIFLLASEQRWAAQDYQDFRKCYQSFLSKAPDKIVKPQLQQDEVKEQTTNEPILEGEARDKAIAKWLEAVKSQKMINPIPKLSRKQIAEEGDWIPKKQAPHPSSSVGELKKYFIHQLYIKHNYDLRTADKLPQWIEENKWIEDNEFELTEMWQEELKNRLVPSPNMNNKK